MWVVLLVVGMVVLGACGDGDGEAGVTDAPDGEDGAGVEAILESLEGSWVLTLGRFAGQTIPVASARRVTLQVGVAGGIGGVASCNNYGAEITVTETEFRVGEIPVTDVDCGGDTSLAEGLYLSALGDTASFALVGTRLALSGSRSGLRFERLGEAPIDAVVDVVWSLVGGAEGGLEAGGASASFVLGGDGSFIGGTGCRALVGMWNLQGDEVVVHTLAAEGDFGSCSPALQAQDGEVLGVTGDGFRVEVAGERLTLISRDGASLGYVREG